MGILLFIQRRILHALTHADCVPHLTQLDRSAALASASAAFDRIQYLSDSRRMMRLADYAGTLLICAALQRRIDTLNLMLQYIYIDTAGNACGNITMKGIQS